MNKTDKKSNLVAAGASRSKKNLRIIIIIVAILLSLLFVIVYFVSQNKPKKNPATEKIRYEKMIKDTDAAIKAEDLYSEKNILENYLKDPPDNNDYLYTAELRLTDACLTLKNYTCANAAGHKAIKAENRKTKDFSVYVMLGDVNVATKNYKDAEEFYQQAKTILKASKDLHASVDLNFVESKLSYVQNVLLKKK